MEDVRRPIIERLRYEGPEGWSDAHLAELGDLLNELQALQVKVIKLSKEVR